VRLPPEFRRLVPHGLLLAAALLMTQPVQLAGDLDCRLPRALDQGGDNPPNGPLNDCNLDSSGQTHRRWSAYQRQRLARSICTARGTLFTLSLQLRQGSAWTTVATNHPTRESPLLEWCTRSKQPAGRGFGGSR